MNTSPTQGNMGEPPILQTSINEERNKNRDGEIATPTIRPSKQPDTKRERLNPLSKEEFVEEATDSQRREGVDS